MKEVLPAEKTTIIETYSGIFIHSDAHRWDKVSMCFDTTVLLDYSSLGGQPAATMKGEDIVAGWSAFLPRFTFTLHYLTNHVVSVDGDKASASCYGHAVHHLKDAEGGDFWEVYGTYDFVLRRISGAWRVTSLRYHHRYASGNLNLPVIASG